MFTHKYHHMYDNMKEPKRFFLFMTVYAVVMLPIWIENPIGTCAALLLCLLISLDRIFYLKQKNIKKS